MPPLRGPSLPWCQFCTVTSAECNVASMGRPFATVSSGCVTTTFVQAWLRRTWRQGNGRDRDARSIARDRPPGRTRGGHCAGGAAFLPRSANAAASSDRAAHPLWAAATWRQRRVRSFAALGRRLALRKWPRVGPGERSGTADSVVRKPLVRFWRPVQARLRGAVPLAQVPTAVRPQAPLFQAT